MDLIHHCIGLIPVPYLSEAFSIFKLIWGSVRQSYVCKEQLCILGTCVAQLLTAVNTEIHEGCLVEADVAEALENLCQ
jgi:hypothetical protein